MKIKPHEFKGKKEKKKQNKQTNRGLLDKPHTISTLSYVISYKK